jgi:peptidoglycan/LPS O-acetylase OafA/YrhL
MTPPRQHPRPDIEGLRGVAILLVVLFHAGVQAFAGAFVAVDVFFVLSGFFITGLLVRELTATGDLGLIEFWGRRSLRLLPPMLVVLFATLALVMWLWAPIDRVDAATTARAVAWGGANVEFARTDVNYFRRTDDPLLHTWSLGVEQQFYVVWPLLLLGCTLLATRGDVATADSPASVRRRMLGGIVVAGALSFLASLWLTNVAQPWAFFSMPSRVWEFALGGALAVLLADEARAPSAERRATMLQLAGLLAVAVAIVMYDRTMPYPGAAALLPALGAVALLVGGHDAPDSFVSRLLGARWLRWFGGLSYAWYLWHWPLVGLGTVLNPAIGPLGKLAWSGIALGLAWLTLRFIERPAREGRLSTLPPRQVYYLAFGATLASTTTAQMAMVLAAHQASRPEQRRLAAARFDRMSHECWARSVDDLPSSPCEFGDTRSKTTVVLMGDSHAEHWLGGFDRVGRERGWKIVAFVKGGCPVADIPGSTSKRESRTYRECVRYREAMLQRIVALEPDAVVLSSWDHYVPFDGQSASEWQVTPGEWRNGLRKTYTRLSAAGLDVVAIRGTPRTWFDVPACLSRRAAALPFAGDCSYARGTSLSPAMAAAQDEAARGLRVRVVDMNDQVCQGSRCGVTRGRVVVFTDDNHLTASFTRSLAPVLGPRVQAAFAQLGVRLP